MKPGRAISLLSGVVLLGAVAKFNEMSPDAQESLRVGATEIAQSWLRSAIAAYNGMTAVAVVESSGPVPPDRPHGADSHKAAGAPPLLAGPHGADTAADASGNPLWALPLAQLSTTRERPIFSPSRRLPPPPPAHVTPVAIQQPVKPPEAERPTVSLIGTIIGTGDDRLGVFVDTSTQGTLRLRLGEDYHGWVARLINPREAILVKDGEPAVALELPPPGGALSPKRSGRDAVLDRVWKVGAD